jgi:hypothetical protein
VSAARLDEINRRLDDPPVIDESVSRHMGLFAVARLAERHGVRVRLRAGTPEGLTALVWLPDNLTEHGTHGYGESPQRLPRPKSDRPLPFASRLSATNLATEPQPDGELASVGAAAPTAGSRPQSRWFRNSPTAGSNTTDGGLLGAPPSGPSTGAFPASAWGAGQQAAEVVTNPVRGDRLVAGMPVRVPRANYVPGSPYADQQPAPDGPAAAQDARQAPTPRPRSAEMARNRLSGFQQGSRRAEGQASRIGEGTGR